MMDKALNSRPYLGKARDTKESIKARPKWLFALALIAMVTLSAMPASAAVGTATVTAQVMNVLDLSVGTNTFDWTHAGSQIDPRSTVPKGTDPFSVTVKSNRPWELKVNSDRDNGKMTEWDTTLNSGLGDYVSTNPNVLTNPVVLAYSTTSQSSLADFSATGGFIGTSTQTFLSNQAATGFAGQPVYLMLKQTPSWSDIPLDTHVYHIVFTFTATPVA